MKKPPHLYKESELGWIPKEWEVERLGNKGSFKNGINKSKEDFGFGTKFVNIIDAYNGEEIYESSLGRLNASNPEIEIYKLQKGDIILVRSSVN